MITIHQATQPRNDEQPLKLGLALAGGGPLGAIYELGALRALDELLLGTRLHQLDVYVGVSAGSLIAASLANGISTSDMCRTFLGHKGAEFVFKPERFMKPALGEFGRRAAMVPRILIEELLEAIRHPGKVGLAATLDALSQALPTGVFSNENIERFLRQTFERQGRSNDFRKLRRKLFVVSVDLDSGAAVRFGSPGFDELPISLAVQASAALPGLYPPVEYAGRSYVDGALRRTMHGSAALEEGVDLLLGVNPLVPYNSLQPEGSQRRLVEGGLPLVLSQTLRALIQSRVKVGFDKYRNHYPAASLLLLEPDRNDSEIFFTNILSYSSRTRLCEHAYQKTRRDLRARESDLLALLRQRGLDLNQDILHQEGRSLVDSLDSEPRPRFTPVANQLSNTLDELDELLNRKQRNAG